jgi:hypothetical protein
MRTIFLVACGFFLCGEAAWAEDASRLPGSNLPTEEYALMCPLVFVGEVKNVSAPAPIKGEPGASSHQVSIVISQQLVGAAPQGIPITVYTFDTTKARDYTGSFYEHPPEVGRRYLFLADALNGQFGATKVLFATTDNISAVENILRDFLGPPQQGVWTKFAGHSLKVKTTASKSDAIFIGEVLSPGAEVDQGADAEYAGPLLRGVKVKVAKILRGSVEDQASLSLFVETMGGEKLPQVGQSYIFFVQTKGEDARGSPWDNLEKADAATVAIKLLSATDDNVTMVGRTSN